MFTQLYKNISNIKSNYKNIYKKNIQHTKIYKNCELHISFIYSYIYFSDSFTVKENSQQRVSENWHNQ